MSELKIGKYSSKALKMLLTIDEICASSEGVITRGQKILIYHDRVKQMGVIFIRELLINNGYIEYRSDPTNDTKCAICGKRQRVHTSVCAQFTPARFMCVYSELDSAIIADNITQFNSTSNIYGGQCKIFIGSQLIRESYDFSCIRHLFVMCLPTNISTLKQVIGRGNRKYSHVMLSPEQRDLKIYLFISVVNLDIEHIDNYSPEEYRYSDKMDDYKTIQVIERQLYECAFDGAINRNIIMSDELKKQYFADGTNIPKEMLGSLYYIPAGYEKLPSHNAVPDSAVELYAGAPMSTVSDLKFNANKYYIDEIKQISFIIKNLFIRQTVWTYDDLWEAVKYPPFKIEMETGMFSEYNFIISIYNLTRSINKKQGGVPSAEEFAYISTIFDPTEQIIYKQVKKGEFQRFFIKQCAQYYILCIYNENVMYNELDVETYTRNIELSSNSVVVDIRNYNLTQKESHAIETLLTKYEAMYDDGIDTSFLIDAPISIQKRVVRRAIINSVRSGNQFYDSVLKQYDELRVLLRYSEIKVYKDVMKIFTSKYKDSEFVGYSTAAIVNLYDRNNSTWIKVNKFSLNLIIDYKETGEYIGYIEDDGGPQDELKFKIRRSTSNQDTKAKDKRLIERGIVCKTKKKHELLKIYEAIGGKEIVDEFVSIQQICEMIAYHLLKLERRERAKESRVKYFYGWWNEIPRF